MKVMSYKTLMNGWINDNKWTNKYHFIASRYNYCFLVHWKLPSINVRCACAACVSRVYDIWMSNLVVLQINWSENEKLHSSITSQTSKASMHPNQIAHTNHSHSPFTSALLRRLCCHMSIFDSCVCVWRLKTRVRAHSAFFMPIWHHSFTSTSIAHSSWMTNRHRIDTRLLYLCFQYPLHICSHSRRESRPSHTFMRRWYAQNCVT